jgi:hypothetical protein
LQSPGCSPGFFHARKAPVLLKEFAILDRMNLR